ncbi:MAG TPA: choline-sulfatase [Alphaproteobacteria bacterium]|nr:choline-sulfatase [Alphaproteobacteria bacterium]
MPTPQPNFLIVMADQLTPGALCAYGGRIARTPHIDALAGEGVVFDSAYCNSPLCAPSRGTFLYGLLPSRTGVYDNAAEFPAAIPTFAHHLRCSGYLTALSGKMHFCGADQLHGFEERLTTDIYPADFGWTPDWENFEARPSWYHNMLSVTQAGPCVRTNQLDYDDEVIFCARRKIYEIARERTRRPFCLVVSMTHPHDPFAIAEEYWNRYREDEIDAPRVTLGRDSLDPHSLRLRHVSDMDRMPVSAEQVRNARRAYFGAVSYVDDQLGLLRRTLDESGLADDTVTILLADHGEMLGERGLWYKMSFFEGSARVPLIVSAPRRFSPRRVAASVSLADILPTLLDLAGLGASADCGTPLDGQSLVPHLDGKGGHDEVVGEYVAEGAIAPIVMVRRGRHKFVHCPADPDQLYDLSADRDEVRNLATDRSMSDAVRTFRDEVAARWDLTTLHQSVILSQHRRRIVTAALAKGAPHPWDFEPYLDSSRRFVRNNRDLDDTEAAARLPRIS